MSKPIYFGNIPEKSVQIILDEFDDYLQSNHNMSLDKLSSDDENIPFVENQLKIFFKQSYNANHIDPFKEGEEDSLTFDNDKDYNFFILKYL